MDICNYHALSLNYKYVLFYLFIIFIVSVTCNIYYYLLNIEGINQQKKQQIHIQVNTNNTRRILSRYFSEIGDRFIHIKLQKEVAITFITTHEDGAFIAARVDGRRDAAPARARPNGYVLITPLSTQLVKPDETGDLNHIGHNDHPDSLLALL